MTDTLNERKCTVDTLYYSFEQQFLSNQPVAIIKLAPSNLKPRAVQLGHNTDQTFNKFFNQCYLCANEWFE